MSSRSLGVIVFILCASYASGQVKSIHAVGASRSEKFPQLWLQLIQNDRSEPLEAFFISYLCDGPSLQITRYDSLFDYSSSKSVPPHGYFAIEGQDPSKCTVVPEAAIFSDGYVEGTPDQLDRLYDRRRGAFSALKDSIQLLQAISEGKESVAHVIDTLNTRIENSKRARTTYAVGYTTICVIVRNVLKKPDGNLRIVSDGSTPHVPTIDSMMKLNGTSYDLARVEVLDEKLERWQAALEDHTAVARNHKAIKAGEAKQ